MDVLVVILKSLGMSLGICAITLVVFGVGMLFWVRASVRDRVFCFFLSENRQMKSKLHKPTGNTIIVGSGADAVKYVQHSSKQFWSFWPPGMPRFVQEPVSTLLYVEGNIEPLDPYDRKSLMSPEALMKISDEAMLKQTWKDVRETMGMKPAIKGNLLLLVLVLIAVAMSSVAAYLAYTTVDQLDVILKLLGG